MTQDFWDPEIFSDFIIEAREHLETIEPNLLELEKAPGNLELLNEIFRPMHSLKGASGFLGLEKMNALAHKAENILDALRKGDMAVTAGIMDVILASTDALRQIIDCLESTNTEGDVDTAPMLSTLDALLAGEPCPDPSPEAALPVSPDRDEAAAPPESPVPDQPRSGPENGSGPAAGVQYASLTDWVAGLARRDTYSLNSFGDLGEFVVEAREILGGLGQQLLTLEEKGAQDGRIHDVFRMVHNLKGNSGIIGYQEMNAVAHEAENLLNSLRHGERAVTDEVVDLLLLVVDIMDALVAGVNPADGTVTPVCTDEVLACLRRAESGETNLLPAGLQPAQRDAAERAGTPGKDHGLQIFAETTDQLVDGMAKALEVLAKDSASRDSVDAIHRSLVSLQNACGFMGFEEVKVYAQRTANLVDQARTTGLDFSLMQDLLEQECAIVRDMIRSAVREAGEMEDLPSDDSSLRPDTPAAAPASQPSGPRDSSVSSVPVASDAAYQSAVPVKATVVTEKPREVRAEAAPPAESRDAKVQPQAGGAKSVASEPPPKTASTIRVDHEKLDRLMELIGELIINRNRYSMIARQLEEGTLDVSRVAQDISETTYAMARISDDLQDTIMKVRMLPVASVFSRFPRLVRDLSRKSGKDVELITEGEETELDKSVVEVIGDPLVHLIRNSVDHGIEAIKDREAMGKDPKGRVWLRAYHKGNSVAIEIEDDGKGIDPEKMREVAVRKGIISQEEARTLDDREARELIFAPGFSSADQVTDISGRGVGMDVVRTNIKSLKGSISINSEVGKGTKFTLSLPLTLAIIDALMVTAHDAVFAIPLDAVSETTKIEAHRLTDVNGRKAVTLRGEVLGIVSLAEMLGLPEDDDVPDLLSVVVIQDHERRLGLVVDRLLERQEIVIKPLSSYLGDLKGISGATIMGDGSVILILDPHELYIMATSKAL